ncbi:MAG: cohesin domain-containing protein [Bacteroidota bacterium]
MTRLIPALLPVFLTVLLAGCGGGGGDELTPPPTPDPIVIPAVSALMTGQGAASARTLSTPSATVTSGQSVSLPVFVDDASGLAGATLSLRFDPSKLACTDATSPMAGVTVVVNPAADPGHAIVVLAGTTPALAGRQIIASFVLRGSGAAGTTPIAISGTVFDALGNAVASTDAPSQAAVMLARTRAGIIGDLTGMSIPSAGAAIKVMNVVSGLAPSPASSAVRQWDANQNGTVDHGDAVEIMRCAAGLGTWPIASRSAAGAR